MKNVLIYLTFLPFCMGLLLFSCEQNKGTQLDNQIGNELSDTMLEGNNRGQAFIDDDTDNPNVLQVAIQSPDHTTLVKAVQAAEVENALVNVGPLTVFAPNNSAFDKIDEATLNDLMKEENKAKLSHILVNHVAPSNYPIETLMQLAEQGRQLFMASGEYVDVEVKGDDVYVDGKKILGTIHANNGWVHVIDEVILPKN